MTRLSFASSSAQLHDEIHITYRNSNDLAEENKRRAAPFLDTLHSLILMILSRASFRFGIAGMHCRWCPFEFRHCIVLISLHRCSDLAIRGFLLQNFELSNSIYGTASPPQVSPDRTARPKSTAAAAIPAGTMPPASRLRSDTPVYVAKVSL